MPIEYIPGDIQALQVWTTKTGDVMLALRANNSIMLTLQATYRDLGTSSANALHVHAVDTKYFADAIQGMIDNTDMQIPGVQLLLNTLIDHRELVRTRSEHEKKYLVVKRPTQRVAGPASSRPSSKQD